VTLCAIALLREATPRLSLPHHGAPRIWPRATIGRRPMRPAMMGLNKVLCQPYVVVQGCRATNVLARS